MATESLSKNLAWSGGLYRIPINIGLVFRRNISKKMLLISLEKSPSTLTHIPDIACYHTSKSIPVRSCKLSSDWSAHSRSDKVIYATNTDLKAHTSVTNVQ